MQDNIQEAIDQSRQNGYPETYCDFNIARDSVEHDYDLEVEGDTDPFGSNLSVLQARIAAAEARESNGVDDNMANVLKARQALAEAKLVHERENQASLPNIDAREINQNPSNTTQKLTASRIPQPRQNDNPIANILQFSSSVCAVLGGVLLSSNTGASKYGFILLACSSSQLFLSSLMLKQKNLMIYGGSVFILVDCLGIYRWLLQS